MMIKGPIREEERTIANTNILATVVPQYISQMLTDIKEEININILIVVDFNILLITINRSSRQKMSEETQA